MPNVNGTGCNDQLCEVRRKAPIIADFSFTAERPSNGVFVSVEVLVGRNWFTMARNQPICSQLILGECPLEVGGQYIFRSTAIVPGIAPLGFKTFVRIRAVDDQRATVACVQIAAKVV